MSNQTSVCTYHDQEHPIEHFRIKKNGNPTSWCRAAFAEDQRARTRRKAEERRQQQDLITTKVCTSCDQELSFSSFDLRPDRPEKLQAKCRECYREWRNERAKASYQRHAVKRAEEHRTRYWKDPEHYRAIARKHAAKPETKARRRAWAEENTRPWRQHCKDQCEQCQWKPPDREALDVHHCDGDKKNNDPSNLQTLCPNCHRLHHLEYPPKNRGRHRVKEDTQFSQPL